MRMSSKQFRSCCKKRDLIKILRNLKEKNMFTETTASRTSLDRRGSQNLEYLQNNNNEKHDL